MVEAMPDRTCITLPDGACVGGLMAGLNACMHDVVEQERCVRAMEEAGYLEVGDSGATIEAWEEGTQG